MVTPTKPNRSYSFTDNSVNNPASQQPGDKMDAEFDENGRAISETIDSLALIQNPDGTVANDSVGPEQLTDEAKGDVGKDQADRSEAEADNSAQSAAESAASATAAGNSANQAAVHAGQAGESASRTDGVADEALASRDQAVQSALEADASETAAGNWSNWSEQKANEAALSEQRSNDWAEKIDGPVVPAPDGGDPVDDAQWSSKWWALAAPSGGGGGGGIIGGVNVGSGIGAVYQGSLASTMRFRTLKSSDGTVDLTLEADEIDIKVALPASGEVNTSSNVGGAAELAKAKVGTDLPFRTILSTSGVLTISQETDTLEMTVNLPPILDATADEEITGSWLFNNDLTTTYLYGSDYSDGAGDVTGTVLIAEATHVAFRAVDDLYVSSAGMIPNSVMSVGDINPDTGLAQVVFTPVTEKYTDEDINTGADTALVKDTWVDLGLSITTTDVLDVGSSISVTTTLDIANKDASTQFRLKVDAVGELTVGTAISPKNTVEGVVFSITVSASQPIGTVYRVEAMTSETGNFARNNLTSPTRISVFAPGIAGGVINNGFNHPGGWGVFDQAVGDTLNFKSFTGGTNVTIDGTDPEVITISAQSDNTRVAKAGDTMTGALNGTSISMSGEIAAATRVSASSAYCGVNMFMGRTPLGVYNAGNTIAYFYSGGSAVAGQIQLNANGYMYSAHRGAAATIIGQIQNVRLAGSVFIPAPAANSWAYASAGHVLTGVFMATSNLTKSGSNHVAHSQAIQVQVNNVWANITG